MWDHRILQSIWKFGIGLGQALTLIDPYVNVVVCANIYTFILHIYTVNVNYTHLSNATCMSDL